MIDTAVILAAGRGSRLKEVTATRSKSMAPVAGKPIIGRVIDNLQEAGISQFIVIGAPHDAELRDYCDTIPNARFLMQEKPLGSGNALRSAAAIAPETFLVCACDSIVSSRDIKDLIQGHAPDAMATLSVIEVPPEVSLAARSVVAVEGDRVVDLIEKPKDHQRISNLSSLPLYILTNEIFSFLAKQLPSERGEYELPEVFREYIKSGKLVRAVTASFRHDLTDQKDLLALNVTFLNENKLMKQVHSSVIIPPSARLYPPLIIEVGVTIGDGATIGPCAYLERDSIIEKGTTLSNTLVTRGTRASGHIENKVVV